VVDRAFDGLALLIDAIFLDGEQTGRLMTISTPKSPQDCSGSVSLKALTFCPQ
jgi:hypothetical protein